MLYFKSCPRCQTGTIEYTTDMWGKYLSCLMCGYAIHSKSIRPDEAPSNEPSMEAPSLVGAAVDLEADEDDLDNDLDFIDDADDIDDEEEPAARVAFG